MDVFWKCHDPTTLNRQGPDVGSQYRSAIFVEGPAQEAAAITSRQRAQEALAHPIVTEVVHAAPFWPAEEYHQRYLEKQRRSFGLW